MHLRMAVHAALRQHAPRNEVVRRLIIVDLANVVAASLLLMAFDTQEGGATTERPTVYGTVDVVTDGAVLGHRKVLVQKRTAFFGVAGVTVVVDRKRIELMGPGSAMAVVAFAADHLVVSQRVSVGAVGLCPYIRVTLVTGLGLAITLTHRVLFMDQVAAGADNAGRVMSSPLPMLPPAVLMALETESVQYLLAVTAGRQRCDGTGRAILQGMIGTRSVASLTVLICEEARAVGKFTVRVGFELVDLILVALNTEIVTEVLCGACGQAANQAKKHSEH